MIFNSRKLFLQSFLCILSVFLFNILVYFILKSSIVINKLYLYILPLNLSIPASFDFLNQIPSVTILGLITLIAIFFTIIALSFNLNSKFPDKIIYKYIVYNWNVISYLAIIIGFLIFQLIVLFINKYNIEWSFVFILDLTIAIILTVFFFYWFVRITNKKGIFRLLNKNIEKKHFSKKSFKNSLFNKTNNISIKQLGSSYLVSFTEFDKKKIPEITPKVVTDRAIPYLLTFTSKEGLHYSAYASKAGIVKIDNEKLNEFIKKYSNTINYIIFPKEDIFISEMQQIYTVVFYMENTNKIKELISDLSNLMKIIETREIEEINDWILFLDHSRNVNPKEIEDDFKFLEAILKKAVESKQFNLIKLIFGTMERNFDETLKNNEKVLEQTISLVYSLKHEFTNNLQILQFIQSRFKNILISYSLTLNNKYSTKYVNAILYLSEFIRFDFMKKFEDEKDLNKISVYGQIINDNVELGYQILSNTINLHFKETKYHDVYLKEHMQQFISGLQFYYEDPYHYNRDYYRLENKDKEVIDKKCKIIKDIKIKKTNKITDLAFYLLYLIDNKKISKKLIDLIFNFLDYGNVYAEIDPAPNWIMREKLHPEGAFAVKKFPKERFILFYLVHKRLGGHEYIIPGWEYNNLHLVEDLKKASEDVEYKDLKKWIEIDEKKFNVLKKELIGLFTEGIKKCNQDEINKISSSKIDDGIVNKFKKTVHENWKKHSTIRNLFKSYQNYVKKIDKKPKINQDKSFGFYFIFEKSYFINNPPVGWARTLESDYGISLAKNEDEQILKEIIDNKKIQDSKKDLENTLKDGINKLKNEGDLVIVLSGEFTSQLDNLSSFTHKYKIRRSLTRQEQDSNFIGYLEYKNGEIPVYNVGNFDVILIINMQKIAKLVQYSAYKNVNQELYVNVEELSEEDINKLKNIEFPKIKVKIRILENFRLENMNKKAFYGYKLINGENKNK